MNFILVFFLLCIGMALETFRKATHHKHITISRFGKRIVLCDQISCETHKRDGFSYKYEGSREQIFYNYDRKFEVCCKARFSQDENYVYYLKQNKSDSEIGLYKAKFWESEETYVSNTSQWYTHFNKNHQYLVFFSSDDTIKVFDEGSLKYTVNPYYPSASVYPEAIYPWYVNNMGISADGEVILLMSYIRSSRRMQYYLYSAADRQRIAEGDHYFDFRRYSKGYTWLSSRELLINFVIYADTFFRKWTLTDYNTSQVEKYGLDEDYVMMVESADGNYICTVKYQSSPLLPNLRSIELYQTSKLLSSLSKLYILAEPELLVYEPGNIISLELSEDGSKLAYIREYEVDKREYVVLFHTLGKKEVIYPCYTNQYKRIYSQLCKAEPVPSTSAVDIDGLQIFVYVISILMFVFLLVMIIVLCVRYKQMKRQLEEEKIKQRETELDRIKEAEEDKNMRVFDKMPYNSQKQISETKIGQSG